MKTQKVKLSMCFGLAVLICSMMLFAESMSTAFTYQGRLLENGEPGTGTYDLQCKLFDSKTDGIQIGDTLVFEDGNSPDGYFTITIDFGVDVFNGEARYLQMAFRPWDSTDPGDFVVLADRIELTPTPYALQTRGIYVDPNQLVGIGTTDLSDAQLKIETSQPYGVEITSKVTDGFQSGLEASAEGSTAGDSYGVRGASASSAGDNKGLWGWARQPSSGINIGVYGIASNDGTGDAFAGYFTWAKSYFEKEVGIGTTTPTEMLDVTGTVKATAFVGDGSGLTNLPSLSSLWTLNASDIYYNSGNVGIGTTTPRTSLEILGSTGLRVNPGYNSTVYGDFKHAISGGLIINANANGGWADMRLQTDETTRLFIESAGRVGIGTESPTSLLDIKAANDDSSGGLRVTSSINDNRIIVLQDAAPGDQGQITVRASNSDKIVMRGNGNTYFNGGNVGIGTTSPSALFEVAGLAKVELIQITGADLAEKFPVSESVKPGMVVAIDPEHPGQLCLARGAYSPCVAGVVSGAGDLPAGAILGNLPGHEDAVPIALSGRVWVHCDTTQEAIKPGDMLTSSEKPGYAMGVSDHSRAHGAVLGKAMTRLQKGQSGMVLVLVNLQ